MFSDYDKWKLATPPEYELTAEEEDAIWELESLLDFENQWLEYSRTA